MKPKIGDIIYYDCICKGIILRQNKENLYVFVIKTFIFFVKNNDITLIPIKEFGFYKDKILTNENFRF